MIRTGRADVMVAGGSDAPVSFALMKAWEEMRVLAPGRVDPSSACRPFSRDRQGLVIGEGAGIVVLEEWERARARGAVIRAELAGYGATADAGHITQPGIDAPARAVRQALAQAKLPPECIDYVSAHGTGTRVNDPTETTIPAGVRRARPPPGRQPIKSMIGTRWVRRGRSGSSRRFSPYATGSSRRPPTTMTRTRSAISTTCRTRRAGAASIARSPTRLHSEV
jgi:3-oxoacyl-(acyl-carrier-protein) synthase